MFRHTRTNYIHLDANRYLDLDRCVFVKDGLTIHFSTTQFLLLKCLCEYLCRPVSREELIQFAWGSVAAVEESELYVYINRIRNKIEERRAQPKYLLSVRGYGYLLYSYMDNSMASKPEIGS